VTIGEQPTAPTGKDIEVWARVGQAPESNVDLTSDRPTAPVSPADLEYWIEWLAGHE
jgi:hypothetical protein